MTKHYKVIWVNEKTRKLAKELSGKSGVPMKDYIQLALEKSRNENLEILKERKKKIGFDFKI